MFSFFLWWSERLHFHIHFPQNNQNSLKYKSDIVFTAFLSLDQNLISVTGSKHMFIIYVIDLSTKNKM